MMPDSDRDEEQLLVNQIHDEVRKIRRCKTLLDNNDSGVQVFDPLEKALIENNSFKVVLDDNKLTGCSVTKLNPIEDLLGDLKNEVEFIGREISKVIKKITDQEESFARINKNCENLELMLKASNSSQVSSRKLDVMERNIKQRFLKEKRELKTIIATLFPDNLDLQDLIAQITEFYFTEGADKYMQLENSDNITEQVEVLLRTEMFELNPHDPTQIKLSDFT